MILSCVICLLIRVKVGAKIFQKVKMLGPKIFKKKVEEKSYN